MSESQTPHRPGWLAAGVACLALGTIGIVVPLLPTVDMYGLAAFCFARGNRRWEARLLAHPRLGPQIHAWRTQRAVPLPAKCLATASMTLSCGVAVAWMPGAMGWLPALFCLPVLGYLWTRPTLARAPCKT
ncbi:MAG: YbaN family protein [Chitinophagaceae bacterium]|nr:YbaN family protein [Rubrivivax sp.]